MAWSTRELANLAGTTVNTVRHYHREGLLPEPERRINGYKRYEVAHLLRLLQILRLRDLGVPLDQIDAVGMSGDTADVALRAIDADLATSIERLQRARAEIKAVLAGATATDAPAGFENIAGRLSRTDRSLLLIYSRLYDDSAMADLKRMVEAEPEDTSREFDELAADADEQTRERLAEIYATHIATVMREYPWLTAAGAHMTAPQAAVQQTVIESVATLYNEAQRDVLVRASLIAHETIAGEASEGISDGA